MKKMAKTGLLILTQPLQVTRKKVPMYLKEMNRNVEKLLYVHIQPSFPTSHVDFAKFQIARTPFTTEVRNLVKDFYTSSADICSKLDIRVLLGHFVNEPMIIPPYKLNNPLDIVFVDNYVEVDPNLLTEPFQASIKQCFQSSAIVQFFNTISEHSEKKVMSDYDEKITESASKKITEPVIEKLTEPVSETVKGTLDFDVDKVIEPVHESDNADSANESLGEVVETHNHVVLGGTFDRLHTGHKMLLTEGCLLSRNILTVGVTDGDMNKKKTLYEMMEPVQVRMKALQDLVEELKPSLEYRVVPIYDGAGPTIVPSEPKMDLIVLSQETKKGGQMINTEREKRDLVPLLEYTIELVEDMCHSQYEEEKISSSSQRKRLLGTLFHPLKATVTGKERPYVIGLTGGIASGKSAICRRLEGQGAVTVDCDKLGHKAYLKGTQGFDKVVSAFGEDIVGEDGEIDRKILGGKVFADKSKLDLLNSLVWPEIASLAQTEIQTYAEAGKRVVVLDAAVLLEAGWDTMVQEVWVTIIPQTEAIIRMGERNNLSEEQAKQRLESQLSNTERVQRSNVILSSLWEPEYTQSQVEKAWKLLQQRLGGESGTA